MPRALMVQGTASGVGKSWLAAALCRLLARRGLRVLPFKAQNLSNNAAPARRPDGLWGEIGRAQALQAEAAGVAPSTDMNPILIKPHRDGAQVIVHGLPDGLIGVDGYRLAADRWWAAATESYARLSAQAEILVLEGAGSPAEINLASTDRVNMAMARHADARVLLVGDIDRGGVFASLIGTMSLLQPEDRARVTGLVINRFRGDVSLLTPGLAPLAERAGAPVLGVLPYRSDLVLDDEDSLELNGSRGALDVCVLHLPTVSNTTDFAALQHNPGVGLRWERDPERVGNPDLLILPGSKDTPSDLAWLRHTGLDRVVVAAASRQIPVLGLCGGYQMLGQRLDEQPGLGLLGVSTRYAREKVVRPAEGQTSGAWLLPAGLPVRGYEIHHGLTTGAVTPLVTSATPDGDVQGLVAGCYLHGLLDGAEVLHALLSALRARRGLAPQAPGRAHDRAAQLDRAADLVERHLDLRALLA